MTRDSQDQLGWGNHDTVVTGTQDGSKQVSKNEWNDSINQGGLFGFVKQSGTISTNAIVPTGSVIEIQLDGTLNTLTPTNNNEFDLIYLIGKSGEDAITITHNASGGAGNIRLLGGASITLSTTTPTILMCRSISGVLEWVEYGISGTILTPSIITSSLTTVGTIGSGTWQGTAVADSYVASASTWNGKQDALTFGISNTNVTKAGSGIVDDDFIRVDGTTFEGRSASEVLSDIGGQASLSFGISNTNVTKCGSGIVDDDFIRIDGTTMEGRSASEVLSDIGASAVAGSSSILTVGALDAGSITSNFGNINTGSSTITTTGALASGAITTSGTLTMGDNIITGIHSLDMDVDTVAYGASVAIDFTDNEEIILGELTGNIEFTSTTYALGKHKVIHMDSDGSARTFTFPAGWVFYGTKPTTTVADKKSILSLSCLGATEALCRAVFVEEA